jgi:hypothetical protein
MAKDNNGGREIKIKCFYCGEKFLYPEEEKWNSPRGHCDSSVCKEEHAKNVMENGIRYYKYKVYLQKVRKILHQGKERMLKPFYIKKGELFREGGIRLGRIIDQDKNFLIVQEWNNGGLIEYSRRCIAQ